MPFIHLGTQVDDEFPIAPLLVSVQIRARCRYRRSRDREFGRHQLLACFLSRPGRELFESVLLFKSLNTNCSLRGSKHLDLMKLSANTLVDAVGDVINMMAVHSLIVRIAAIFFEHFFLARGALVFPVYIS